MSDTRTGRCYCGAVTVTLHGAGFGVIACHCDDCQKMHGNFFAMIAVASDDVEFSGAEHIRWFSSSEKVRRAFCDVCGSRIAKEPVDSGRMLVSVGLFGAHTGLRIRKQVFETSKPDWYDLPKFD